MTIENLLKKQQWTIRSSLLKQQQNNISQTMPEVNRTRMLDKQVVIITMTITKITSLSKITIKTMDIIMVVVDRTKDIITTITETSMLMIPIIMIITRGVVLNIISTMMDMMTLLVKLVAVVLMILKLIINMHVLALQRQNPRAEWASMRTTSWRQGKVAQVHHAKNQKNLLIKTRTNLMPKILLDKWLGSNKSRSVLLEGILPFPQTSNATTD